MPRNKTSTSTSGFAGFDRPESNYFRMPNNWTDITAEISNIAELKVVEYILRHTWGYQEYDIKKHITVDEFVRGRRRQDGSRFDKGTGLSERAVRYGLQAALQHGLIEEEVDDSDRGRVKKYYSLRMKPTEQAAAGQDGGSRQDLQPGVQSLHPGLQGLPPSPATVAPRSEKDTGERHLDFELRKASLDVDNSGGGEGEPPLEASSAAQRRLSSGTANRAREPDQPPPTPAQYSAEPVRQSAGSMPLGDLIRQRQAAAAAGSRRPNAPVDMQPAIDPPRRRRGRPAADPEEREIVVAFMQDFALELHDQAPLSSTVTRVLKIFRQGRVPKEQFSTYLYQARSITQERSAQITKRVDQTGKSFAAKNKVPYYLAVLEDLLGLKADQAAPSAPK